MLKVALVFMIEYQFKGKTPEPKRKEIKVSKNYLDSKPGIIEVKDKWPELLCTTTNFFGGKYDLIQLHRQIIHQNDGISMRNSLKPSPPAFSI